MFGRKKNNLIHGLSDMHCHILFGVDDGASDIGTSMTMLRQAHEDGINNVVLTPHYHPRRGKTEYSTIVANFETLKNRVKQELPDMVILLGREVCFLSDFYDNKELLIDKTMNGSKYILLEFLFETEKKKMENAIVSIKASGYKPIIAHIERYICTVDDYEFAAELKQFGALIQVNADSVMGKNGSAIKKYTKYLLDEGLVDFIATDAHDTKLRKPELSKCFKYIESVYGSEYAEKLMKYDLTKVFA